MKKLLLLLLLTLPAFGVFGQSVNNSRTYVGIGAELPSYNLSGINLTAQKLYFDVGYKITDNFNMFLTAGSGLIAQRLENTAGVGAWDMDFTAGIGTDYLYPISSNFKLGAEVRAGMFYGEFNASLKDAFPLYYQAGLKLSEHQLYTVLGFRQRQFVETDIKHDSSSELFLSIGFSF